MADIYSATSIKFPIELDEKGSPVLIMGIPCIEQSLEQVLEQDQESVYFNRGYGSELYRLDFEPTDTILKGLAHFFINDAIENNEPRLIYNPNNTVFTTSPGKSVDISIVATIQSSGQQISQDTTINNNV